MLDRAEWMLNGTPSQLHHFWLLSDAACIGFYGIGVEMP
jgi:hypothetical protein